MSTWRLGPSQSNFRSTGEDLPSSGYANRQAGLGDHRKCFKVRVGCTTVEFALQRLHCSVVSETLSFLLLFPMNRLIRIRL